jgi:hypothetical protein
MTPVAHKLSCGYSEIIDVFQALIHPNFMRVTVCIEIWNAAKKPVEYPLKLRRPFLKKFNPKLACVFRPIVESVYIGTVHI